MDIVNRLPREYIFLNYLRCHDDIGWGLDYATLSQWGMKEVPHKQYLNDYFHDGSFTLEPENSFDEYPFENLLNENLNRHFHYEKDFAGGVILSYDYSNHTEYLQPGDDANKFLEEAEKIENGILQVNATEQLDNLIGFYFPDFFPEDYHEENTKRFITRKEIE